MVDLFVRSWVEIHCLRICARTSFVDLFVRSWVEIFCTRGHIPGQKCRPLREVVSWNSLLLLPLDSLCVSTSSWGRELKYIKLVQIKKQNNVDLFVRSWVEIFFQRRAAGFQYRRPLREVVSWNIPIHSSINHSLVDLFVRSWVEIPISSVTISLFAFRTERQFREKSISSTFNESASDTRRPHTYSILTSIGNTIWHISLCLF